MQIVFDRGTLLLRAVPDELDPSAFPAIAWDPRVEAWRAPARVAYGLLASLRRRGVRVSHAPRPRLERVLAMRTPVLRPYQQAAVEAWRLAGRRGIAALPTGSGKTQVALAVIAHTNTSALCLVPTRALLGQWIEALRGVYDGPIGCLGDGDREIRPVTVATFASAYRHMPQLGENFGLLVVDECHHFATARRDDPLDMSIAPLRLGLSATPPQDPEGARHLARLIGPVVYELSVADLAGEYLAPFERVRVRLWLDDDEQRTYDDLVNVYRHAYRSFQVRHPRGGWEAFMKAAVESDDGRRAIAAWRRARKLVAFPRCKRSALAALLEQNRDRRTLVFVPDNETAYRIASEHLVMPLTCDIGRRERAAVLEHFREGRLRALVSAQVLNEGVDVPDADVGIIVGGRLGEREHTQRVGRLLRPKPGKRAVVYELVVQQSNEVREAERRWVRLAS